MYHIFRTYVSNYLFSLLYFKAFITVLCGFKQISVAVDKCSGKRFSVRIVAFLNGVLCTNSKLCSQEGCSLFSSLLSASTVILLKRLYTGGSTGTLYLFKSHISSLPWLDPHFCFPLCGYNCLTDELFCKPL